MRKVRKRARVSGMAIKVNDQQLSGAQSLAWRTAEAEAQSASYRERARAAARFQALEAELELRRMEREVREGLDESMALARARGEQVERFQAPDALPHVRIRSRDGLETLANSGGITAAQFRAGMLYRGLYEANDPERDLRSQLTAPAFLGGGSSGAAPGRAEAWAERRVRLSRALATVEAKVRIADRNDRAVNLLREVAGHARCLSHMARGGGGQAAYRRSLVLALDVVAGHFGVR